MHIVRISCKFVLDYVPKAPIIEWNYLSLARGRVTNGQNILLARRFINWITVAAIWTKQDVSQRHVIALFCRGEICAHQTMNLLSVWIMGHRSREPQVLSLAREIELPSHPGDRVALAHEEAVAVLALAAVHNGENAATASVGNFKHYGMIAFVRVLWFQEIKVGGKLNLAIGVARRLVQIHNLPVVRVCRIHGEVNASNDFFISPYVTEWLAFLNVGARRYFHSDHSRWRRCGN